MTDHLFWLTDDQFTRLEPHLPTDRQAHAGDRAGRYRRVGWNGSGSPPYFVKGRARTAAANGLRPAELFRIVQPGGDRNPCDLDRYADDPLLYLLADRTGVERDALVAAVRAVAAALANSFARGVCTPMPCPTCA